MLPLSVRIARSRKKVVEAPTGSTTELEYLGKPAGVIYSEVWGGHGTHAPVGSVFPLRKIRRAGPAPEHAVDPGEGLVLLRLG